MTKIPANISKNIDEFVKGVNEILGNRVKKLFYMVPMLAEIIIKVQI